MELPGRADVPDALEAVELPPLARVSYAPETPTVRDVPGATRAAIEELDDVLPTAGTIALGVGSRGIHDLAPVVKTVVEGLTDRGLDPVIVPAMGSHGGATPAGQRGVLESLGISAAELDCPIDTRMETQVIDRPTINGFELPVHLATAALEADAVLPINRVKPHTDFTDRIESGIGKMLAVGFAKQPGASVIHRHAKRDAYVPAIEAAVAAITEATTVPGGIAIVENFEDETGEIAALKPPNLLEREAALLERAREWMPTLPVECLDLLVVDEIGKDVSGTGMDTNVIGRSGGAGVSQAPEITVIYARSLTDGSKGNANGIGLADLVHRDLATAVDLPATYTNAMTSGNLDKVRLPIALPTDELALSAAMARLGVPAPAAIRIAWIKNTGDLAAFHLSQAALEDVTDPAVTVTGWDRVGFEDGTARFEPMESPPPAGSGH